MWHVWAIVARSCDLSSFACIRMTLWLSPLERGAYLASFRRTSPGPSALVGTRCGLLLDRDSANLPIVVDSSYHLTVKCLVGN
jgi:hypothetical protein